MQGQADRVLQMNAVFDRHLQGTVQVDGYRLGDFTEWPRILSGEADR